MATKRNIFFLNDIQDIWLFNALFRHDDLVIYNVSDKITSPHKSQSTLEKYLVDNLGCQLASVKEIKTFDNFENIIKSECKYFITKECHPYTSLQVPVEVRQSPSPVKDKTISIGWVGESTISYADRRYEIRDKYLYHFIEPQLVPIYQSFGVTKNIIPSSPKYYFLNDLNRDSACSSLGLDPQKRYVTLLITKFHDYSDNQMKILDYILQYCDENELEIIFKTKIKYHNFGRDTIKHAHFFGGDNIQFHQTLALMYVSNFVIGFSSCASLEAETIGVPFINFWKNEPHDVDTPVDEQSMEWLYENFHETASKISRNYGYRLAQKDTTFNIRPSNRSAYLQIKDELSSFLDKALTLNVVEKFPIHPIWSAIY